MMESKLPPLKKWALRLETSAASLAGIHAREDISEIDKAIENYKLDAEAFRRELELQTGMPSALIERLLNL